MTYEDLVQFPAEEIHRTGVFLLKKNGATGWEYINLLAAVGFFICSDLFDCDT